MENVRQFFLFFQLFKVLCLVSSFFPVLKLTTWAIESTDDTVMISDIGDMQASPDLLNLFVVVRYSMLFRVPLFEYVCASPVTNEANPFPVCVLDLAPLSHSRTLTTDFLPSSGTESFTSFIVYLVCLSFGLSLSLSSSLSRVPAFHRFLPFPLCLSLCGSVSGWVGGLLCPPSVPQA